MGDRTKFLPPGIMVSAFLLGVAGVVLAIAASPVLVARGGGSVSIFGVVVYETTADYFGGPILAAKVLAGILVLWHAVLLARLDEGARRRVVALTMLLGVLAPLVVCPEMRRIDSIFIRIIRLSVILVSMGVVGYLTRPRIVEAFRDGGLAGRLAFRYCPVCGVRAAEGAASCEECDVPLLERYELDGGIVLARSDEVGADL